MYCECPDYDLPSFYLKTTRKARKRHQCDECRGYVERGEHYERVSGKWDGRPDTYRTCCRCVETRDFVVGNVPCVCWAHGECLDAAIEAIDAAVYRAPEETRGLRFGFLRRIAKISRHNKKARAAHDVATIGSANAAASPQV